MPPTNRISIRPDEVLGIARDSTPEEINRARGKLAKILHPDLQDGQGTAIMQLINHAVEVMLSGQQGTYSFGDGTRKEEQASEPPPRQRPPGAGNAGPGNAGPGPSGTGSQGRGQEYSGQQRPGEEGCPHPKKPGYSQCFQCSGVQKCGICGEGYYRPPNDRCRDCRAMARGGYQNRQRSRHRSGQEGRR